MSGFDTCLPILLREEGGWSNNPRDPGGMTNLGVTRRVWEEWTHKPASESDMRALKPSDVAPLYRVQYWQAVAGDQLPTALALCVFDFAVNGGVARAARTLQNMVRVNQDGHIGPATLAALQQWCGAPGCSLALAVKSYMQARRSFYRALPTFPTFGNGWLARCDRIETQALRILQ